MTAHNTSTELRSAETAPGAAARLIVLRGKFVKILGDHDTSPRHPEVFP